nr:2-aminobenzoate-CoA ligase [Candidatus Liberibacter sp.]
MCCVLGAVRWAMLCAGRWALCAGALLCCVLRCAAGAGALRCAVAAGEIFFFFFFFFFFQYENLYLKKIIYSMKKN